MYRGIATYTSSGQQMIFERTWDEDGNRVDIISPIDPYLFYEDRNADKTYISMFGKPLRKMSFKTNWERTKWIETSKNIPLFEKLSPTKQYLLNKYFGMEGDTTFTRFPFRIFNIDIEIQIDNEFPEPESANYPINVISLYDTLTSSVIVWAYNSNIDSILTEERLEQIREQVKPYDEKARVIFCTFTKEHKMLEDFIKFWENNCPDIVTGWNIKKFDIPYIINRIKRVFTEGDIQRLSPCNSMIKNAVYSTFEFESNCNIWHISAVNLCDYLDLYKKFAGTSRQSFKLDYIAHLELGVGKLDYYEMGYESMKEFMNKDFATFIQYNIIDTVLIKLLDDKLKFISLMRNICNIGLVEYESIFRSIPYILGALTIQAKKQNQYFLTDSNISKDMKKENEGFEGAYVFPTKAGYYKNGIMSFDFNSLYPNVMMTVNISPDTKVGKVVSELTDEQVSIKKADGTILSITQEQFQKLINEKCTLSANNVLYVKPALKFGIIPKFLDAMYKQRVATKNEMKKNKKAAKELEEEINKLTEQLNAL